jgi:hypothetical protein
MVYSLNEPGDYQIEISGWGLDNSFFVERTGLRWTADGEKQVDLHRAIPEGAVVFIRLLAIDSSNGTIPIAYQVQGVTPMDCRGCCHVRLAPLRPRSKESLMPKNASNRSEDSTKARDVQEEPVEESKREEVLR